MLRLRVQIAVAAGICLPVVPGDEIVEYEERNLLVLNLSLSSIADGEHVVRLNPQVVAPLV